MTEGHSQYYSLVIAPLGKFYEAAKVALAELEKIPLETPIDWPFVERAKAKMRAEIAEFEQHFPTYQSAGYDRQEEDTRPYPNWVYGNMDEREA